MTFEEWFEQEFGEHPDFDRGEEACHIVSAARRAWEAAFQEGQDHQRELERLAEYDRSVFGSDEYSKDW